VPQPRSLPDSQVPTRPVSPLPIQPEERLSRWTFQIPMLRCLSPVLDLRSPAGQGTIICLSYVFRHIPCLLGPCVHPPTNHIRSSELIHSIKKGPSLSPIPHPCSQAKKSTTTYLSHVLSHIPRLPAPPCPANDINRLSQSIWQKERSSP
jgi:hypothetical protein